MEILACPHCDRLFRTSPRVLGKKIRCRGCEQIFHVPHDTTNVPLSPARAEGGALADEWSPPIAIAGRKNGREVRSCPSCGRTFAMRPEFVDRTIRCRGCQAPFRVTATEDAGDGVPTPEPVGALSGPPAARQDDQPPASSQPLQTVFDDIGAVLGAVQPGEKVVSVVRPRKVPPQTAQSASSVATLVAVLVGAACSVPVVLFLLSVIDPERFREVIRLLPPFLRFGSW